jgi:hypothetical protein
MAKKLESGLRLYASKCPAANGLRPRFGDWARVWEWPAATVWGLGKGVGMSCGECPAATVWVGGKGVESCFLFAFLLS